MINLLQKNVDDNIYYLCTVGAAQSSRVQRHTGTLKSMISTGNISIQILYFWSVWHTRAHPFSKNVVMTKLSIKVLVMNFHHDSGDVQYTTTYVKRTGTLVKNQWFLPGVMYSMYYILKVRCSNVVYISFEKYCCNRTFPKMVMSTCVDYSHVQLKNNGDKWTHGSVKNQFFFWK